MTGQTYFRSGNLCWQTSHDEISSTRNKEKRDEPTSLTVCPTANLGPTSSGQRVWILLALAAIRSRLPVIRKRLQTARTFHYTRMGSVAKTPAAFSDTSLGYAGGLLPWNVDQSTKVLGRGGSFARAAVVREGRHT